jgi:uncharacterized protein
MIKILLLAIVIWLLYLILRRYTSSLHSSDNMRNPGIATMVQCAHCGVHLPEEESVSVSDKYYCCEAHSRHSDP